MRDLRYATLMTITLVLFFGTVLAQCSEAEIANCDSWDLKAYWNDSSNGCNCVKDFCFNVTCSETLCGANNTLRYDGTCDPDTSECVYQEMNCPEGCGYANPENTTEDYACIGEPVNDTTSDCIDPPDCTPFNKTLNETSCDCYIPIVQDNSTVNPCPQAQCHLFDNMELNETTCTCYTLITENNSPDTGSGLDELTGFITSIPSQLGTSTGVIVLFIAGIIILIIFFFTGNDNVETEKDLSEFDTLFKKRKEPKFKKKKKLSDSQLKREVEKKIYEEEDLEDIPQTDSGKKIYGG
ncbi:MAG: hypothetical protein GOU97_05005 [Nanoarchaeota archaeon]|nr:hypothetical protein [Nanoarchaeota archaeon]